ncbi:uncharacterized protein LOC125512801 isoform X2 [Triticum urartu]|uniref:uncharacterized protein LOC125512801 isoform X2 n=1 Tax=Triticum urartu TaxID=4572 RepID=UPI002044178F|nr:uncharacterized protein LOC125512801 isoform X2 [Triticum urartu]
MLKESAERKDQLSYHSHVSDLSINIARQNRSKPYVESRTSKMNVQAEDVFQPECVYSAESQKDNTVLKNLNEHCQQEHSDRKSTKKQVVLPNYGVHPDQVNAAQNKQIGKQHEVQTAKQSCEMIDEVLAPEGVPQSYTQLMKQMTLMSHLQSDNMAMPITSFTSLLTTSINDQIQNETTHAMRDTYCNEEVDEGAASDYISETNSEDYLACSSDENETDAEDNYLEKNTVIHGQMSADCEYSELQQIGQSWHNSVSSDAQAMFTNHEEQIAKMNEPELQGPDYAVTTDTDGTSGSDESEFETEQQENEAAHMKDSNLDSSDELPDSDQEDETMHESGDEDIEHQQDETQNKSSKDKKKLSQEDIEFFLENEVIEKALKLSQEDEKTHMPTLNMTFGSEADAHRFYNEYAAIADFSIQKAANYHCQKKDAHNNKVTRITLKCNRSGKPRNRTKPTATGAKRRKHKGDKNAPTILENTTDRRRNYTIKTGCQAQMVVT